MRPITFLGTIFPVDYLLSWTNLALLRTPVLSQLFMNVALNKDPVVRADSLKTPLLVADAPNPPPKQLVALVVAPNPMPPLPSHNYCIPPAELLKERAPVKSMVGFCFLLALRLERLDLLAEPNALLCGIFGDGEHSF